MGSRINNTFFLFFLYILLFSIYLTELHYYYISVHTLHLSENHDT
jgi:hypothetical protein